MWARLTELGFGLWLLASPFVFGHPSSATSLWLTDVLSGGALVALTAINFRHPRRRYYLAVPLLGAALIVLAFLSVPHPIPLARQNHVMVGLTLIMIGIVPNRALRPPDRWMQFQAHVDERDRFGRSSSSSGDGVARSSRPAEISSFSRSRSRFPFR